MKNIIIIEDEFLLAEELADAIAELRPDWRVAAHLDAVATALDFFAGGPKVDLIFSDIQLGDGLSFEIFSRYPPAAPVIFCTAYNQYALQAFKSNAIDYLLKPFDQAAILQAIDHYERLSKQLNAPAQVVDYQQLIQQLVAQKTTPPRPNHLLVRHKDKIIPIKVEDIALIFIHHSQTMLVDFHNHRYMLSETLDELEAQLGARFYRIDRQHLVHRPAVVDVSQYFNRRLALNLKIEWADTLTVRKEKASDFLDWLSA